MTFTFIVNKEGVWGDMKIFDRVKRFYDKVQVIGEFRLVLFEGRSNVIEPHTVDCLEESSS